MRLFISYARVDTPLCKQIVHHLQGVHEVWYDHRLYAGQDWWKEILRRLDWCEGFVYLLSPESVTSEYCWREYTIAAQLGRHIFPVLIQARTEIPDELSHLQYADLSEGMEDIITLMNALTIAERQLLTAQSVSDSENASFQLPILHPISPAEALGEATAALEKKNYAHAIGIIKEALAQQPPDRIARMLKTLLTEAKLEQEDYLHEAEREYAPIRELFQNPLTLHMGCVKFQDFEQKFPDYDPDNFATHCRERLLAANHLAAAASFAATENASCLPDCFLEDIEDTPIPNFDEAALQHARSFIGKRNHDWQPYVTIFPDLPIPDMPFCLVPVGTFNMGNNDGLSNDEKPVHPQTIDRPYWIAQYPVINAQWKLAVEAGVVSPPKGDSAQKWYADPAMAAAPVVGIDWFMARDFAAWMNGRLPSELEWEYAARGVESLCYPWSNDWNPNIPVWKETSEGKPAVVTQKPESQSWVAAVHLSGNVWEWTSSLYESYPYHAQDGRERDTSKRRDVQRVLRGGAFGNPPGGLHAANRLRNTPDHWANNLGVRLVRSVF